MENNRSKLWTVNEIELLTEIISYPITASLVKELFPDRTLEAVRTKRRRLRLKIGLWGCNHQNQKISYLKTLIKKYNPRHIVELFSGAGLLSEIYANHCKTLICNERHTDHYQCLEEKFQKNKQVKLFNDRANRVLNQLNLEKRKFNKTDWIDLDPFGSVLQLLPQAFDLINEGFIYLTLTDLHQLRFSNYINLSLKTGLEDEDEDLTDLKGQLSFVLGRLLFDLSKRYYWNGNMYFRKPKTVKPIEIHQLGDYNNRIFRILLHVKVVKTVKELHHHIYDELKLFEKKKYYPYYNLNGRKI